MQITLTDNVAEIVQRLAAADGTTPNEYVVGLIRSRESEHDSLHEWTQESVVPSMPYSEWVDLGTVLAEAWLDFDHRHVLRAALDLAVREGWVEARTTGGTAEYRRVVPVEEEDDD